MRDPRDAAVASQIPVRRVKEGFSLEQPMPLHAPPPPSRPQHTLSKAGILHLD